MTHLSNWGAAMNNTVTQTAMGMTPQQIKNSNQNNDGFLTNSY